MLTKKDCLILNFTPPPIRHKTFGVQFKVLKTTGAFIPSYEKKTDFFIGLNLICIRITRFFIITEL